MSGLVKSAGKVFKRITKSKVVRGLAIAAAVYFTAGLAAGAMGNTAAAELPGMKGAANLFGLGETGAFAGAPPGTDAAGASLATPLQDTSAPMGTPGPDAATELAANTQQQPPAPAPATAPPPTPQPQQPGGAPVVDKSVPATPATPANGSLKMGSPGNGIIRDAASWFGNLSPGAQQVLAQGAAGGAAGMMQALAAKNAQEDAEAREERAREDRRRRGSVPDISAGIINSRRGG